MDSSQRKIAIIDYGMGNLRSVKNACRYIGYDAEITSDHEIIRTAFAVILPGVGAFPDAMRSLQRLELDKVLHEIYSANKPLIAICLGMQLLMSESHEFAETKGLDIVKGCVLPLEGELKKRECKLPHIGWSQVDVTNNENSSILGEGIDKEYFYFCHSFYVKPQNEKIITTQTQYGGKIFCASFIQDSIYAFQFHPERSGSHGMNILINLLMHSSDTTLSMS